MATKAPAAKKTAAASVSDKKIREIAHSLWVEAGKPEGQAEDHWFKAIEMAAKAAGSKPAKKAAAKPAVNAPAKPAAKPAAKAATKPAVKLAAKAAAKPAAKASSNAAAKPAAKPVAKNGK
jgi:Protein of unknown function (DUF2934)